MSRYKKILSKLQEENKKSQELSGEGRPKFDNIKFMYPQKIRELQKLEECIINVLPQPNGHYFFYGYKKHGFKVNRLSKFCVCLNSEDREGNIFGSCFNCKVMEDFGEYMTKEMRYELYPKDSFSMLISINEGENKDDLDIYRLEVNKYMLEDILNLIDTLKDPSLVDKYGFKIKIGRDENKWDRVVLDYIKLIKPPLPAFNRDIVDLETVIKPGNTKMYEQYVEKQIMSYLKASAPNLAQMVDNELGSASFEFGSNVKEEKPSRKKKRTRKPVVEEEDFDDDEEEETVDYEQIQEDSEDELFNKIDSDEMDEETVDEDNDDDLSEFIDEDK